MAKAADDVAAVADVAVAAEGESLTEEAAAEEADWG